MALQWLDHIAIQCLNLERTRSFYCDVLGLEVGPRPAVDIPGYWLYCGERAVIHLAARASAELVDSNNGAFDHVAFRLTEPDRLVAVLKAKDIPHTDHTFSVFGIRQIVVNDPDGVRIELNCPSEP